MILTPSSFDGVNMLLILFCMQNDFRCNSVVVKIASRCNLNCTYCYMYNLGDSTYKDMPKFMSDAVYDALLLRIKRHCEINDIKEFQFIFHGGEPLLIGMPSIKKFVSMAEAILLPDVIPLFNIQSNATLITSEWCAFFEKENISLSISLDGYKEINDENRVYHNGAGSFDDIVKAINIISEWPLLNDNFGVLSVINIKADPRKLLALLSELDVINVDFLLPNANFIKPPVDKSNFKTTEYGDWLIQLFDIWYTEFTKINIRFFTNFILTFMGVNYSTDAYGEGLNEVLVIETDGGIEAVDVLKICGHGFTKEGLNVMTNSFEDAADAPLIRSYITSHESIPMYCQHCSLSKICAAGYLPHRFAMKNNFENPSVYCNDLAKLITHIQAKILLDMPDNLIEDTLIERFSYQDFLKEREANDAFLY